MGDLLHMSTNAYISWAGSLMAVFVYASVFLEGVFVLPAIWHRRHFRREIVDTILAIIACLFYIGLKIDWVSEGSLQYASVGHDVLWKTFEVLVGLIIFRNLSVRRMFYCGVKARCLAKLAKKG